MMRDQDSEKANRVMQAILEMKKIDIERLEQAYGRSTV
jgi:predicted 3-demethylubiquinone-9 3-methyltransferase (glyoxalase superfamily)